MHEISVQPLTAADSLTCFEFLACFYFRTEAAAYKINKNKVHTKYSGFIVSEDGKVMIENR